MRTITAVIGAAILGMSSTAPAVAQRDTPAAVTPVAAVITGDLRYGCFGCGTTTATFRGSVTASTGDFPLDAVVVISATANVPANTCPATETLSGTIAVEGETYAAINWSRVGSAITLTTSGGAAATGTGTWALTRVGSPCGSTGEGATVTLQLGAAGSADPDDTAYPSAACFLPAAPGVGQVADGVCAAVAGVAVDLRTGEMLAGRDALTGTLGMSAHMDTVIEIAYDKEKGKKGSYIVVTTSHPRGCHDGTTYALNLNGSMRSWNDRISSAWTYAGCYGDHYEDWDYQGSMRRCTCPTMGVMNNETTSIRWHR